VQDVEACLARRRVVARGEDEDVLFLDLVETATADVDAGEQGPGVEEVESEPARVVRIAAVDRDAARQSADDDRGRGRYADPARPDDPDPWPCHRVDPTGRRARTSLRCGSCGADRR